MSDLKELIEKLCKKENEVKALESDVVILDSKDFIQIVKILTNLDDLKLVEKYANT